MRQEKAEAILKNPDRYFHNERIFLNNPVITLGMGLAPLVVMATSVQNALILMATVALLLTPTRVLSSYALRKVRNLLARGLIYCGIASVIYAVIYLILSQYFGTALVGLGVYLPVLVVEPLIIYRYGRVPETPRKAAIKGLQTTVGYSLILLLLGGMREFLAQGTLLGVPVGTTRSLLPFASLPAGGFILLGLLCAAWRAVTSWYKRTLTREARNQTVAYMTLKGGSEEQ